MNYITPDIEIKKLFIELENDEHISTLLVGDATIYSLYRYHLEIIIRVCYSESINKIESKELNKSSDVNLNQTFFKKLKEKVDRKLYYSQFDKLENFKGNSKLLFVATSPQVNKNNNSIELVDVISDCNNKNINYTFVLPEYNYSIERNKSIHQKNYFALNEYTNNTFQFSKQDLNNIELFKEKVCAVISFLTPKDLVGINGVLAWQIKNANALQKILKVVKPQSVIARSLYSDKWVSLAAKRESIDSIEVQHGVFTNNNFYYHALSTLNNKDLLIPDKILCLGNEWLTILRQQSNNWTNKNSATLGVKNFFNQSNSKINKPIFLIALQDLSVELFNFYDFLVDLLNHNPEIYNQFEVVIRPHPIDVDSKKIRGSEFQKCRISYYNLESVNDILPKTSVLFTASSMMLYEAQALNITTVSLEKYRYLTLEKNILFLNETQNFIEKLKEFEKNKIKLEYTNEYNFNAFEQIAC